MKQMIKTHINRTNKKISNNKTPRFRIINLQQISHKKSSQIHFKSSNQFMQLRTTKIKRKNNKSRKIHDINQQNKWINFMIIMNKYHDYHIREEDSVWSSNPGKAKEVTAVK